MSRERAPKSVFMASSNSFLCVNTIEIARAIRSRRSDNDGGPRRVCSAFCRWSVACIRAFVASVDGIAVMFIVVASCSNLLVYECQRSGGDTSRKFAIALIERHRGARREALDLHAVGDCDVLGNRCFFARQWWAPPHHIGSLFSDHDRRRVRVAADQCRHDGGDRKSTRLNSSHQIISYAVFCLKKKKKK